jgi:hypothetical protein
MASLVGAAAEETRSAGSKKMTPYHLFVSQRLSPSRRAPF